MRIDHEAVHGEYGDGTPFTLSKPIYRFEDWADGEPGPGLVIGPRVGQQLIGVGLLDAVPAEDLLRNADPHDEDGDGISGRAHILADGRVGRFGWKAGQPTVRDQVAAAFAGDLGITSPLFPDDDMPTGQRHRLGPAPGHQPEIAELFAAIILERPGFFDGDDAQDLYTVRPVELAGPDFSFDQAYDPMIDRVMIIEAAADLMVPGKKGYPRVARTLRSRDLGGEALRHFGGTPVACKEYLVYHPCKQIEVSPCKTCFPSRARWPSFRVVPVVSAR